jgi:two-component system, LuxR family, response regulator FixJ
MPSERMIHVVDDDAAVRHSLKRLLDSAGFESVLYETPDAFLDAVQDSSDGCALLDVHMPGMDGMEVHAQLTKRGSRLPVIVMTGQSDVQTAVRAMKAGAVDFIEKPFEDRTLLDAISLALARGGTTDHEREASEATQRVARLSHREREVLEALVSGQPSKVIAFNLGISVRTVEVHRARMMERLGVRQFAEAVRLAVLAHMSS